MEAKLMKICMYVCMYDYIYIIMMSETKDKRRIKDSNVYVLNCNCIKDYSFSDDI
jgi:hypothetical protein